MRLPSLVPPALHTTDRPSSTAQWTTLGRALELGRDERIVTDVYAPVFLTAPTRALYRSLDASGPLFRSAERREIAGLAASVLCRHAFIDEHLLAALDEVEQVIVLGAGYDARAYRFAAEIGTRPVFEVDLAPLSRRKAALITAHADLFGHASVRRVEIDFRTDSLAATLTASGFERGVPTFVVWEGVTMYLTREAVDGTLHALADVCGAGSVLALDFWQRVPGAGGSLRVVAERAMRWIGEPITFPIAAADTGALLEPHGFTVVDLADARTLTDRHATGGRHCDPGMYLVAARLG